MSFTYSFEIVTVFWLFFMLGENKVDIFGFLISSCRENAL